MSKKKWIAVVMLCVSLAVIIALPAFASNNAQIKIPRDFFVKFAKTIKYRLDPLIMDYERSG